MKDFNFFDEKLLEELSLGEALEVIVSYAGYQNEDSLSFIVLLDEFGKGYMRLSVSPGKFKTYLYQHKDGLLKKVWETDQPVIISNYQEWDQRLGGELFSTAKSIAAVPIKIEDKFIGMLGIYFKEERQITAENIKKLDDLANFTTTIIKNASLVGELLKTKEEYKETLFYVEKQKKSLEALHEISLGILNQRDIKELLASLLQKACDLFQCKDGCLCSVDPMNRILNGVAGIGRFEGGKVRFSFGTGVVGRVAESGEPLVVEDYDTWPGRIFDSAYDDEKTCIAIPLKKRNETIAVIGLDFFGESRSFSKEDMLMLQRFSELASLAIVNADLTGSLQESEKAMKEKLAIIEDQNIYLHALHDAIMAVFQENDLDKILELIILKACAIFETPDGCIYWLNSNETRLVLRTGAGKLADMQGYSFCRAEGAAGKALLTGEPQIIPRYCDWAGRNHDTYWDDLYTCVSFPLFNGEKAVGVLVLDFFNNGCVLAEDDIRKLAKFTQLASIAITNKGLNTSLERKLQEQKMAEQALLDSKRKYQTIFDSCRDSMFIYELKNGAVGRFLDVNDAAVERLGYTKDEFEKILPYDIILSENIPKFSVIINSLKETDSRIVETVYKTKAGRKVPVEVNMHLLNHNGQLQVLSVARDMSERKQREMKDDLVRSVALKVLLAEQSDDILTYICAEICKIFNLRFAFVAIANRDGSIKTITNAETAKKYLTEMKLRWDDSPQGNGSVGRSIRFGTTELSNYEDEASGAWSPVAAKYGIKSSAAIPIYMQAGTAGSLCLYSPQHSFFSEEYISQILPVVQQISIAINAYENYEQLRLLKSCLNAAADGILIVDNNGQFFWANESFEQVTGYSIGFILSTDISVFFNEHFIEDYYLTVVNGLAQGDFWEGELRCIRRDGGEYYADLAVSALKDADGVITHYIHIIQDITERLKMQAELEANQKKAARTEKVLSLGTMAAGIAHEINQPLNVIKIIAAGIEISHNLGKLDSENLLKRIRDISSQADRIDNIVKHMREIIFNEGAGKPVPTDINMTVESALAFTKARLEAHNIKLRLELNEVSEALAEKVKLEEVWLNLINNAVYALDNSPLEDKEIFIRTLEADDNVVIEVMDNGPGIEDRLKESIFEPFFTTKDIGEGMGVGLSLVQSIIESFGGDIRVSDNKPQGARFKISLTKVR